MMIFAFLRFVYQKQKKKREKRSFYIQPLGAFQPSVIFISLFFSLTITRDDFFFSFYSPRSSLKNSHLINTLHCAQHHLTYITKNIAAANFFFFPYFFMYKYTLASSRRDLPRVYIYVYKSEKTL